MVIPHKHYKNREFVILPLEEIAPNWIDPQTNYSISQIKSELEKSKLDNIRKLWKIWYKSINAQRKSANR